jgi:signal peptide peptidase SppA
MRLQHVAEQIYYRPWLITPSGHASIQRLLETKFATNGEFKADSDTDASAFFVQREPAAIDVNGIGHVHVKGVIGQGLSKIEKSCGNTDTKDVQTELAALVAQNVKGILLCIDSPGGMVTGTPELAETIAQTALEIPVFVFSDSQICSAAYWLAAGATRVFSTESADIGSIGVYMPWIDRAAQWEQEGIKADPVINTGGTFKAIGFAPSLSEQHRAQLQAQVDRIFGLFRDFVVTMRALNEAVVPDAAMQGQTFLGIDALANGLVDQLGSKDDSYEALLQEIDFSPEPAEEPAAPSETPSESPSNTVASPATS